MCKLILEAGSRGGLQEGKQSQKGDLLLYIDTGIDCHAVCLYCAIICNF